MLIEVNLRMPAMRPYRPGTRVSYEPPKIGPRILINTDMIVSVHEFTAEAAENGGTVQSPHVRVVLVSRTADGDNDEFWLNESFAEFKELIRGA